MPIEMTICHIIDEERKQLVLKRAVRGISNGKWNAPGGLKEPNETPAEGAIREVLEETGLRITDPFYHGRLFFYFDGDPEARIGYLFSAKKFSGELKSTDEGECKWFNTDSLPYNDMWSNDRHWIPWMLAEEQFEADFYMNNKKDRELIKEPVKRPFKAE